MLLFSRRARVVPCGVVDEPRPNQVSDTGWNPHECTLVLVGTFFLRKKWTSGKRERERE